MRSRLLGDWCLRGCHAFANAVWFVNSLSSPRWENRKYYLTKASIMISLLPWYNYSIFKVIHWIIFDQLCLWEIVFIELLLWITVARPSNHLLWTAADLGDTSGRVSQSLRFAGSTWSCIVPGRFLNSQNNVDVQWHWCRNKLNSAFLACVIWKD